MRVVAYLRVSTASQADSGHGLDAQHAAIEEAEHRGWDVTWTKDAGISGARSDRPGLAYALTLLETGQAEALVVSKLDRLGRTVTGLGGVIEHAARHGWSLTALDMRRLVHVWRAAGPPSAGRTRRVGAGADQRAHP